jgi:hypothetical protein
MHNWRCFLALFGSYRSNHFVIHQLTRRAVLSRYRGSALGLVWSLLTPMLMLAIYTFVFGFVFKARWPAHEGGLAIYPAILFSGMIIHALLSDCLIQSTTVISDNPQYVKKVVFPLIPAWNKVDNTVTHESASSGNTTFLTYCGLSEMTVVDWIRQSDSKACMIIPENNIAGYIAKPPSWAGQRALKTKPNTNV